MIHVVFPVYNRADLLRQTLESWREANGIEWAVLDFWVEPGCEESADLCAKVDWAAGTSLRLNPTRKGHAANVAAGMRSAFRRTNYAILTVDDYLVSTDILELHEWHKDTYAADKTVLCLRSGTDCCYTGGAGAVLRTQLMGLPAGFHADMWQLLAVNWDKATDQGWWQWVNEAYLQGGPKLDVLAPAESRAFDLGSSSPSGGFVKWVNCGYPVPYFEVRDYRERAVGFQRYIEKVGP